MALKGQTKPPTAADEIKAATRDMHETIQEGKKLLKELRTAVDGIADRVDEEIGKQIQAGLTRYQDSLEVAIDKATEAVDRRFDTISDILLGEDAEAKGLSLKEYAERVADAHRFRAERRLTMRDAVAEAMKG